MISGYHDSTMTESVNVDPLLYPVSTMMDDDFGHYNKKEDEDHYHHDHHHHDYSHHDHHPHYKHKYKEEDDHYDDHDENYHQNDNFGGNVDDLQIPNSQRTFTRQRTTSPDGSVRCRVISRLRERPSSLFYSRLTGRIRNQCRLRGVQVRSNRGRKKKKKKYHHKYHHDHY